MTTATESNKLNILLFCRYMSAITCAYVSVCVCIILSERHNQCTGTRTRRHTQHNTPPAQVIPILCTTSVCWLCIYSTYRLCICLRCVPDRTLAHRVQASHFVTNDNLNVLKNVENWHNHQSVGFFVLPASPFLAAAYFCSASGAGPSWFAIGVPSAGMYCIRYMRVYASRMCVFDQHTAGKNGIYFINTAHQTIPFAVRL